MFSDIKNRICAALGAGLMLVSVAAFSASLFATDALVETKTSVITASAGVSSVGLGANTKSIKIQNSINNLISVSANEAKDAGKTVIKGSIKEAGLSLESKGADIARRTTKFVLKTSTGIVWDYDNGVLYGEDGKGLVRCGFDYDIDQDIFYSSLYPWQRSFGYCKFYDDAAAKLDMDYDTLRFYFTYAGKDWLIQAWKGRYGITTGGELGIYKKAENKAKSKDEIFYKCAEDDEMLEMGITIYHNGKVLFTRKPMKHWWQTGFVLNYMADKKDVGMVFSVKFDDAGMLKAFKKSIPKSKAFSYKIKGNTVTFKWNVK